MNISSNTAQAVELLKKMISIPSQSRNEEKVADMLFKHMQLLGLEPNRLGNNVYCIAPGYDSFLRKRHPPFQEGVHLRSALLLVHLNKHCVFF